jgi:hypothetical protein
MASLCLSHLSESIDSHDKLIEVGVLNRMA